jgi:biopolymer transport protein ExbD
MRFNPSGKGDRLLDVDITAMIDVVFLLIVFFMTTAQFARLTRANVDLPKEQGRERAQAQEGGIVVNVTRSGEIIVDGKVITLDDLFNRVSYVVTRESDPDSLELLIRADLRTSAGVVNAIAQGLAERGVRGWRLATEPTAPQGGAS